MHSEEIRERVDHFRETTKQTVKEVIGDRSATAEWIGLRIQAEQAVYLGELAAQVAELNQTLNKLTMNNTLAVTPCQGDELLVKIVS